jgi:hypothetical protein
MKKKSWAKETRVEKWVILKMITQLFMAEKIEDRVRKQMLNDSIVIKWVSSSIKNILYEVMTETLNYQKSLWVQKM